MWTEGGMGECFSQKQLQVHQSLLTARTAALGGVLGVQVTDTVSVYYVHLLLSCPCVCLARSSWPTLIALLCLCASILSTSECLNYLL
jgi:hypothetical protein